MWLMEKCVLVMSIFLKQQCFGLAVGIISLFIVSRLDYHLFRKFVVPLFFLAVALLVMVFIPGVGTTVYGAARWIELGPLSFQPSEVMKLAIILYLAAWLSGKQQVKNNADFFEGYVPFVAILSLVGFLIIKQPDTGTLGLIFCIALTIFLFQELVFRIFSSRFLGGLQLSHF